MHKIWYDKAWDDYLSWQTEDKKTLKRINQLIRDIERTGDFGIVNPKFFMGISQVSEVEGSMKRIG